MTDPAIDEAQLPKSRTEEYIEIYQKVEKALDLIRPGIQMDGGNIALVDVEMPAGKVVVQLSGACVGCPSSIMTLKMGVEECIRSEVPQITEVVAI